jgi:hypothetical protein
MLYETNKKFIDENIKYQILLKENEILDKILLKILKTHPNKDLAKKYNEIINENDIILNCENENLKFEKIIEHLEKEFSFITSDKFKRNIEVEKKILCEIEKLKIKKSENENSIKTSKEKILKFEQNLCENSSPNIFKSNQGNNFSEADELYKSNTLKRIYQSNETIYSELEKSYDNIKSHFPGNPREIDFEAESSFEYNSNKYIPPSSSLYKKTYKN